MKKIALIGLVLLLSLVFNLSAGGNSQALEQYHPEMITLAAGDTSGTYYAYGLSLAALLGEKLRTPFRVLPTHGSVNNISLINSGQADLAIIQNDIANREWYGSSNSGFAAVGALYNEECHIVASPVSGTNGTRIRSIEDLRGKAVSIGEAGSGTEVNALQILDAYGMGLKDIYPHHLSYSDSVEALKNGIIDAFFCVAGAPVSAITRLTTSSDVIFLEIDDEHAAALIRYNPYYSQYEIPAGTYRGQESGVKTLAIKATLVANWQLSEDLVYQLTKSLFESRAQLQAVHAVGTELNIQFAQAGNSVTIPFHPGANRYYKEMTGSIMVLPLEQVK